MEDWLIAGQGGTATGRIASQAVLHGIAVLLRKHPRAAASLTAAIAGHLVRGTAFEVRQTVAGWFEKPDADDDYLDLKAERGS